MASKLYVGGLPFSATSEQLRDQFARCGTVVAVNVITDRFSGQSRGFGFVEMSTDAEAKGAIEMFDGQPFNGRRLKVAMATPQAPRADRSGNGKVGGGRWGSSRW